MKTYKEFLAERTFDKKRVDDWTKKVMGNYADSSSGRLQFNMDGRTAMGFRQDELDYGWTHITNRTKSQNK